MSLDLRTYSSTLSRDLLVLKRAAALLHAAALAAAGQVAKKNSMEAAMGTANEARAEQQSAVLELREQLSVKQTEAADAGDYMEAKQRDLCESAPPI